MANWAGAGGATGNRPYEALYSFNDDNLDDDVEEEGRNPMENHPDNIRWRSVSKALISQLKEKLEERQREALTLISDKGSFNASQSEVDFQCSVVSETGTLEESSVSRSDGFKLGQNYALAHWLESMSETTTLSCSEDFTLTETQSMEGAANRHNLGQNDGELLSADSISLTTDSVFSDDDYLEREKCSYDFVTPSHRLEREPEDVNTSEICSGKLAAIFLNKNEAENSGERLFSVVFDNSNSKTEHEDCSKQQGQKSTFAKSETNLHDTTREESIPVKLVKSFYENSSIKQFRSEENIDVETSNDQFDTRHLPLATHLDKHLLCDNDAHQNDDTVSRFSEKEICNVNMDAVNTKITPPTPTSTIPDKKFGEKSEMKVRYLSEEQVINEFVSEIIQILKENSQVKSDISENTRSILNQFIRPFDEQMNLPYQNVSCNSGYFSRHTPISAKTSIESTPRASAATILRRQLYLYDEENQKLQRCLEKARLVTSLQCRAKSVFTAREKATAQSEYEKALQDFEASVNALSKHSPDKDKTCFQCNGIESENMPVDGSALKTLGAEPLRFPHSENGVGKANDDCASKKKIIDESTRVREEIQRPSSILQASRGGPAIRLEEKEEDFDPIEYVKKENDASCTVGDTAYLDKETPCDTSVACAPPRASRTFLIDKDGGIDVGTTKTNDTFPGNVPAKSAAAVEEVPRLSTKPPKACSRYIAQCQPSSESSSSSSNSSRTVSPCYTSTLLTSLLDYESPAEDVGHLSKSREENEKHEGGNVTELPSNPHEVNASALQDDLVTAETTTAEPDDAPANHHEERSLQLNVVSSRRDPQSPDLPDDADEIVDYESDFDNVSSDDCYPAGTNEAFNKLEDGGKDRDETVLLTGEVPKAVGNDEDDRSVRSVVNQTEKETKPETSSWGEKENDAIASSNVDEMAKENVLIKDPVKGDVAAVVPEVVDNVRSPYLAAFVDNADETEPSNIEEKEFTDNKFNITNHNNPTSGAGQHHYNKDIPSRERPRAKFCSDKSPEPSIKEEDINTLCANGDLTKAPNSGETDQDSGGNSPLSESKESEAGGRKVKNPLIQSILQRVERSSSEEEILDEVDMLERSLSPSLILKQKQREDVNEKLEELNRCAQRNRKSRSTLRLKSKSNPLTHISRLDDTSLSPSAARANIPSVQDEGDDESRSPKGGDTTPDSDKFALSNTSTDSEDLLAHDYHKDAGEMCGKSPERDLQSSPISSPGNKRTEQENCRYHTTALKNVSKAKEDVVRCNERGKALSRATGYESSSPSSPMAVIILSDNSKIISANTSDSKMEPEIDGTALKQETLSDIDCYTNKPTLLRNSFSDRSNPDRQHGEDSASSRSSSTSGEYLLKENAEYCCGDMGAPDLQNGLKRQQEPTKLANFITTTEKKIAGKENNITFQHDVSTVHSSVDGTRNMNENKEKGVTIGIIAENTCPERRESQQDGKTPTMVRPSENIVRHRKVEEKKTAPLCMPLLFQTLKIGEQVCAPSKSDGSKLDTDTKTEQQNALTNDRIRCEEIMQNDGLQHRFVSTGVSDNSREQERNAKILDQNHSDSDNQNTFLSCCTEQPVGFEERAWKMGTRNDPEEFLRYVVDETSNITPEKNDTFTKARKNANPSVPNDGLSLLSRFNEAQRDLSNKKSLSNETSASTDWAKRYQEYLREEPIFESKTHPEVVGHPASYKSSLEAVGVDCHKQQEENGSSQHNDPCYHPRDNSHPRTLARLYQKLDYLEQLLKDGIGPARREDDTGRKTDNGVASLLGQEGSVDALESILQEQEPVPSSTDRDKNQTSADSQNVTDNLCKRNTTDSSCQTTLTDYAERECQTAREEQGVSKHSVDVGLSTQECPHICACRVNDSDDTSSGADLSEKKACVLAEIRDAVKDLGNKIEVLEERMENIVETRSEKDAQCLEKSEEETRILTKKVEELAQTQMEMITTAKVGILENTLGCHTEMKNVMASQTELLRGEFESMMHDQIRSQQESFEKSLQKMTRYLDQVISKFRLPRTADYDNDSKEENLSLKEGHREESAAPLERSKDRNKDYNALKLKILELTSQRDAEMMFHKITRESLRAMERDHDRLRQEFFLLASSRRKGSSSRLRHRIHAFGDDISSHHDGKGSSKCVASLPPGATQEDTSLQQHRRRRSSSSNHQVDSSHPSRPCDGGRRLSSRSTKSSHARHESSTARESDFGSRANIEKHFGAEESRCSQLLQATQTGVTTTRFEEEERCNPGLQLQDGAHGLREDTASAYCGTDNIGCNASGQSCRNTTCRKAHVRGKHPHPSKPLLQCPDELSKAEDEDMHDVEVADSKSVNSGDRERERQGLEDPAAKDVTEDCDSASVSGPAFRNTSVEGTESLSVDGCGTGCCSAESRASLQLSETDF